MNKAIETNEPCLLTSWQSVGQALQAKNLINEEDNERFFVHNSFLKSSPLDVLVRAGVISEATLVSFLSSYFHLPAFTQSDFPDDFAMYTQWLSETPVKAEWWQSQTALLWPDKTGQLHLVSRNIFNVAIIEAAQKSLNHSENNFTIGVCTTQDIEQFWEHFQSHQKQLQTKFPSASGDEASYLRELAEEAPVIEYINNLFAQAVEKRASDIHLNPQKQKLIIHFRIDGVLIEHTRVAVERFNALSSRIKLIADIDIAEKRLPQDGRILIRTSGKEYDVRVSTLPGIHGESIVMRLLPSIQKELDMATLGMMPDHIALFDKLIHTPHGVFLVTGPTGSGKSTTLYSALGMIHDGSRKIITIEDPVEYGMNGITQIQVNSDIDLTFASVLRSSLRQDPDIILVGEIRDLETAQIAIQASLTGHLVLSTLHTNDSLSAFTRLIDMGVDPFLITTPAVGIMAQRLARKLCEECSIPDESIPATVLKEVNDIYLDEADTSHSGFFQPQGCPACNNTGYRGRIGMFELIAVDEELRAKVIAGESTSNIWEGIQRQGVRNLRQDGLLKAKKGLTSLEEVIRLTAQG